MKTVASRKLLLIGVVFLAVFALSYAASKNTDEVETTQDTKSLKKHSDFLGKYLLYDFGGGHGHYVYFDSPATMTVQDFSDANSYDANYGFTELGDQTFLMTWVDNGGNTTTHIVNAKKGKSVAHSVPKNAKAPTAKQSSVSMTTNKATATAAAATATRTASSTNSTTTASTASTTVANK